MRYVVVLAVAVIAIAALLASPLGLYTFHLLLGWAMFIGRAMPRVAVSADGVATALLCVLLLAVGGHLFASWLLREIVRARAQSTAVAARWRVRWTLTLLMLVVLTFSAGIAATGVVHQVGWLARPRSPLSTLIVDRRFGSRDVEVYRLKEIGLAIHNAGSANDDRLPATYFNAEGKALHSWQAATMGYLYTFGGDWDRELPWDDPRNSAYFRAVISTFLNPRIGGALRDERGYALSHFAGNVHVLGENAPHRASDFVAGTSQTLAAGEVTAQFMAWGNPSNLRDPLLGINTASDGFGGPSGDGANLLFLDGSVRFVRRTVDPAVMRGMSGANVRAAR